MSIQHILDSYLRRRFSCWLFPLILPWCGSRTRPGSGWACRPQRLIWPNWLWEQCFFNHLTQVFISACVLGLVRSKGLSLEIWMQHGWVLHIFFMDHCHRLDLLLTGRLLGFVLAYFFIGFLDTDHITWVTITIKLFLAVWFKITNKAIKLVLKVWSWFSMISAFIIILEVILGTLLLGG